MGELDHYPWWVRYKRALGVDPVRTLPWGWSLPDVTWRDEVFEPISGDGLLDRLAGESGSVTAQHYLPPAEVFVQLPFEELREMAADMLNRTERRVFERKTSRGQYHDRAMDVLETIISVRPDADARCRAWWETHFPDRWYADGVQDKALSERRRRSYPTTDVTTRKRTKKL